LQAITIDFQGVCMHARTRYPVPSGAEMTLAAPPVVPASGDAYAVPSRKIVEIIGVIDEIALQTRALAQRKFEERSRRWQKSLTA
jgi:hypothetical protein